VEWPELVVLRGAWHLLQDSIEEAERFCHLDTAETFTQWFSIEQTDLVCFDLSHFA
jgi:hypothetical protein